MNSNQWLDYYQQNRCHRPEPKWNLPSPLDRAQQRILARSLSHFQLGETGGGTYLLENAGKQVSYDPVYREALGCFIAEEGEHARLLERLVLRFGGATIHRHWTHGLFRLVRRGLGFQFEIQVLVIAELVGTAYYRLLRTRTADCVLDETCGLLLRDEAQHVEFHAQWLGKILSRLLPVEASAWRTQFQALFLAAAVIAWIDHRSALIVSGSSRQEFFGEARRECIRFLHQLEFNSRQLVQTLVPA